MRRRLAAGLTVILGAVLAVGLMTGPAGADPTRAKNSLTGTADCGPDGSFLFTVNSANGQGAGTDNNGNQALWTPAHLNPGNGIFHPTAFDLTFTFTPTGGSPQPDTQIVTRKGRVGDVSCDIFASQTFPGGSFTLEGSVIGWIS